MFAKKHILLIICTLCLSSQLRAQLVFTPATHDFGTIREADGQVSCTFKGVNKGDKPVVILDVVTTCGCTVPEFSRQPILPGAATEVLVRYDPMNRPGVFSRGLDIYSSERKKIATLTIRGSVTPRQKTTEELYPVDAGGGLRLSSSLASFSYIYPGQLVQTTIDYTNTSLRTIHLLLQAAQPSGMLRIDAPQQLAPGEQGTITLSYLIPADKPRYGTISDALAVKIDGRPSGKTLVAHAIGVDAPRNSQDSAPKAQLSENILKFGAVKQRSTSKQLHFTITNEGNAELIVRAVESEGRFGTSLRAGQRISPGGALTAEVTLDPRKQEFGIVSDHLVLITNDPWRPMRRLRVTAIIED